MVYNVTIQRPQTCSSTSCLYQSQMIHTQTGRTEASTGSSIEACCDVVAKGLQTLPPFPMSARKHAQVYTHSTALEQEHQLHHKNLLYPSFSILIAVSFGALRLWEGLDLDQFHCFSIGYPRTGVVLFSFLHADTTASYIHDISLSTLLHLLVTFATMPRPFSMRWEGVSLYLPLCRLFREEFAVYDCGKISRKVCHLLIPYSYHTCFCFFCARFDCKTDKITFRRII